MQNFQDCVPSDVPSVCDHVQYICCVRRPPPFINYYGSHLTPVCDHVVYSIFVVYAECRPPPFINYNGSHLTPSVCDHVQFICCVRRPPPFINYYASHLTPSVCDHVQ